MRGSLSLRSLINIMRNIAMDNIVLSSESGRFFCDENYFAYKFEPAENNIISDNTFKHFTVPEGVAGFCTGFGYEITVKEFFALPKSLKEIGDRGYVRAGVFSFSKLPTVIIPDSVEIIGHYAFSGSKIDALCFPRRYFARETIYMRQFKGSRVHKLYLDIADLNACIGILPPTIDEVYMYRDRPDNALPDESILIAKNLYNNSNH